MSMEEMEIQTTETTETTETTIEQTNTAEELAFFQQTNEQLTLLNGLLLSIVIMMLIKGIIKFFNMFF